MEISNVMIIGKSHSTLEQDLDKVVTSKPQIIVSDYSNVAHSESFLIALRALNNHTPVITILNSDDQIPHVVSANCCGGPFFRHESSEKLIEMIEVLSLREHSLHC